MNKNIKKAIISIYFRNCMLYRKTLECQRIPDRISTRSLILLSSYKSSRITMWLGEDLLSYHSAFVSHFKWYVNGE